RGPARRPGGPARGAVPQPADPVGTGPGGRARQRDRRAAGPAAHRMGPPGHERPGLNRPSSRRATRATRATPGWAPHATDDAAASYRGSVEGNEPADAPLVPVEVMGVRQQERDQEIVVL